MINLFNINHHIIDTSKYSNLLHDKIVNDFESSICNYVGAKYGVTFNSATSALFLLFSQYKNLKIKIPSIIPPVVVNSIITSGNDYEFYDDINWVGGSYTLHDFGDYKVVDSAQKIEKNQFKNECNPQDLMVFSFYPTKPIGSCDGGMIVSNDLEKIILLKEMALNGMSFSENNWDREIKFPGYKMYMNSIQCDIALKNFKKYEEKLNKLNDIRNIYNSEFNILNTSNHLYRISVEDRNNFISFMKDKEIMCGVHYESLHNHPVYRKENSYCPLSELESKNTVSIPFHEELTKDEIRYIINTIKEWNGKVKNF